MGAYKESSRILVSGFVQVSKTAFVGLTSNENGACICCQKGSKLFASDCVFERASTGLYGAGVYSFESGVFLACCWFHKCLITTIRSNIGGCAYHLERGTQSVNDTTALDCGDGRNGENVFEHFDSSPDMVGDNLTSCIGNGGSPISFSRCSSDTNAKWINVAYCRDENCMESTTGLEAIQC